MDSSRIFFVGANGQLGTALRTQYPEARSADISELDITSRESVEQFDWTGVEIILNAAAFTNVDGAETDEGRIAAWNVNAYAVANLARVAQAHDKQQSGLVRHGLAPCCQSSRHRWHRQAVAVCAAPRPCL